MGGTASPRSMKIAGAEDCAPPGGRSPAHSFQSPGTATLQGGLSCRMNGHGGTVPLLGNPQIGGSPGHSRGREGPCPRDPGQ